MSPLIVLTTDFGLSDPFVGVVKGVVLGINPQATVIDLTHLIEPQNVSQAAFVLGTSHRFFPTGTIHVVVVDPEVGTSRQALLLVTPHSSFLAPDNGVLSYVLAEYLQRSPDKAQRIPVPPPLTAYSLSESRYWLDPVSHTFHGRDIFAPVAAHLSLGVMPEALGELAQDLAWLPAAQPTIDGDCISGEVINVDRFGNLVTNIPEDALPAGGRVQVVIKARHITGLSRTYHDPDRPSNGELVTLIGSLGLLEIALPSGSAALALQVQVGEPVQLTLVHRSELRGG